MQFSFTLSHPLWGQALLPSQPWVVASAPALPQPALPTQGAPGDFFQHPGEATLGDRSCQTFYCLLPGATLPGPPSQALEWLSLLASQSPCPLPLPVSLSCPPSWVSTLAWLSLPSSHPDVHITDILTEPQGQP